MAEIKMYEVIARVVSQKGTCTANHKAGDEFPIGDTTPPNMCSWAFYTLSSRSPQCYGSGALSGGKTTQIRPPLPALTQQTRSSLN